MPPLRASPTFAHYSIAYLEKLFGAQLQTVLEHTDEPHPHIHAYALPLDQKGVDAKQLHPGLVAKATADAEARSDGAEPKEAVRAGNRAYKAAMRLWQDQYHQIVGSPSGLTRDGPRRARKSRKQWQEEKAAARHQADLEAAQAAERGRMEAQRRELVQARWEARREGRARAAKLEIREAAADEFRLNARAAAQKIDAGRAEIDQDRATLEVERTELAVERREIAKLGAKLEKQQAGMNRVVGRIKNVVSRFTVYFGLPLPEMLGEAIGALEREVGARTQELERKELEESGDNTEPFLGM